METINTHKPKLIDQLRWAMQCGGKITVEEVEQIRETVKLLGTFLQQEATESLLRHAVYCTFEEVRTAACLLG